MQKNVAGQVVGRQMIDKTTGDDFTGTVTVYVTGDGGTQALGSVGSGVCTHEGNGYHTYAPSQAETNFDHVAFTFIGSGAITRTLEIYTDDEDAVSAAEVRDIVEEELADAGVSGSSSFTGLAATIEDTASNPASVSTPDVTVTAQKITDQIAADRYLRGEDAADTPKRGIRFTRMVPPGG